MAKTLTGPQRLGDLSAAVARQQMALDRDVD